MAADIPFCQRNTKMLIPLLALSSAGVLGFAVWLAVDRGEFSGFGAGRSVPVGLAPAGGPAAVRGPLTYPGAAAAARPATPVAFWPGETVPLAPPYAAPPGVSPYPPPIEAVTGATPGGGIRFIGAQGAPATAEPYTWAADVVRPCTVSINAVRSSNVLRPQAAPDGARFIDPFDGVPERIIDNKGFESVGSGVIVDPTGYVVTNHHVIAGATTVMVSLFERPDSPRPASIVAADPERDLALLKILGDGPFPVAAFADSSTVEVGEQVLAVGNPFGLSHTVTAGIVSARRSAVQIDGMTLSGLLQTDAPINQGSSGGPLVNLHGQLVGVNTAIYAPGGFFNGTGFAIPSNRVAAFVSRVLDRLGVRAALPRPAAAGASGAWLGVGGVDITPQMASALGYPAVGGVYVTNVLLDSPADGAELARGDVLASLAGQAIGGVAALERIVAGLSPGQVVPATIWRGGKTETVNVWLGESRPLIR